MDLQEIFADPEIHQSVCRNLTFEEANDLRKAYNIPILYCSYSVLGIEQLYKLKEVSDRTARFAYQIRTGTLLTIIINSKDDPELLDLLFEYNLIKNDHYTNGLALLMEASKNGLTRVVKFLLENGADPNEQATGRKMMWTMEFNWTALNFAIYNDHLDIVQLLVQFGTDLTRKHPNSGTPLEFSIRHQKDEITNYLIEVMSNDPRYQNELNLALRAAVIFSSNLNDQTDIIRNLLKVGANPYASLKYYHETAFRGALRRKILAAIKLFIDFGITQDQLNDGLMWAAGTSSQEIVQLLLEAGAEINSRPIIASAVKEGRSVEFIEYLLKLGADPNITKPGSTKTALVLAYQQAEKIAKYPDQDELIILLKEYGAHL